MIERAGPRPDPAVLEHLPELSVHRPVHVRQVAFLRNHDVDLDPAQRRGVQLGKERLVGDEVGRQDPDRALRGTKVTGGRSTARFSRSVSDRNAQRASRGTLRWDLAETNTGSPMASKLYPAVQRAAHPPKTPNIRTLNPNSPTDGPLGADPMGDRIWEFWTDGTDIA